MHLTYVNESLGRNLALKFTISQTDYDSPLHANRGKIGRNGRESIDP
jgi:hypothetical protein